MTATQPSQLSINDSASIRPSPADHITTPSKQASSPTQIKLKLPPRPEVQNIHRQLIPNETPGLQAWVSSLNFLTELQRPTVDPVGP